MNQGTRFPKRCLAILMAAILIASNFSGLAQLVHAEGNNGATISVGEIVADNYDLTDAEKELITSGLLAGSNTQIEYTAPSDGDGLISVDNEEKKITVKTYDDWTAAAVAYIYVGETLEETVTLNDGVGYYEYDQNAFSVKVTYTLNVDVDADVQETLLGAAAILKQGIKNLDDVAELEGKLYILEQAMPQLVELADNGIQTSFGGAATLSEEGKAAIYAMNDQMTANGGMLALRVMIAEYTSTAKTGYLLADGVAMHDEVVALSGNVAVVASALGLLEGNVDSMVQWGWIDAALAAQLKILIGTVDGLDAELTTLADADWSAAERGTALVVDSVNYAQLDALVAAVTTTSTNTVKNPLKAVETTVTLNMSMFNVDVEVALKVVNEDNEIVEYGKETVRLTLAEDATAAEIEAAVAESGIVADAIAAWGEAYVEGKYVAEYSELPATLGEDITYTITYVPAEYEVSYNYADSDMLPYGYKYLLPVHEDPAQAYDYIVNGDKYPQGSIITIEGETVIEQSVGKAYTEGDLLTIIADNYGNGKVDAILTSGALLGNAAINVRYPDAADTSALLTLVDGVLTAEPTYASSYNGLNWAPYSYGANGNENYFSGNTANWTANSAAVIYRLVLDVDTSDVKAWLDLAKTLETEAEDQVKALNALLSYKTTMGQLDRTKLGALSGIIGVTDLHADPEKNAELKAEFTDLVNKIINECLEGNSLRIYNMISEYETEGLLYYYQNSDAFQNELALVSGYLNGLLDDADKVAAITILVTAAGFPDYADKIANVGSALATLQAALKAPNAAIDLESENLGELVDALQQDGDASYDNYGTLYLYSDKLTVTDASQKTVQIFLNGSVAGNLIKDRGYVLTQADIDALKAALQSAVDAKYGANAKFYNKSGIEKLDALVNVALNDHQNIFITYTAKEFTVVVPGMADQTITIEDLEIDLEKATTAGQRYTYTIDGAEVVSSTYEFNAEQLERLFAGGTYTVERTVIDLGAETLSNIVAQLNKDLGAGSAALVTDKDGNYVGLNVNVTAGQMMDFVLALSKYSYIGLNGDALMDAGELSVQTLVNAMLSDSDFGSASLIALGENGSGKLLSASMQLGNASDDLVYDNLALVINLKSVPAQMGTVASALKQLEGILEFQANNGTMEVVVNLPDKVYGAYLAALLATGNAQKEDMNAVDQQIAFSFLCDYLDAVLKSDADMTTLENTLAMLGQNVDLSSYNGAYKLLAEGMSYTAHADGLYAGIAVTGNKVIPSLLKLLGMEINESLLGIVKEYKEGGEIVVNAHATLANIDKDYNAIILDAQASGMTNKFACTSGYEALNAKLSKLAGYSVVILLDDVDGDLTVSGTTILDLNGKNVSGTITSTGKLFIIDSSMDTYNAGTVYAVSGNVTVIAGNYETDVSAYLKNGYYMDGTTVRNALYYITDENGEITFVVDTNVYQNEHVDGYIPDVRMLALDIVTDLLLNYATTAALSVDGNAVYDVNIEDLVGLLESSNKTEDIIDQLLASIKADGISDLANAIIADLLDFRAIADALEADGIVATYGMTTNAWDVVLKHVVDGDYLTIDILSNAGLSESFNVNLKLEGDNADQIKDLADALAGIVNKDETKVEIEIVQPNYDDKEFQIEVNGTATIVVDMSGNTDYAKILGVILAYGNSHKAAAIAEAINLGDMAALKEIVDETTVKELFTALKAMSRSVTFAEMAEAVGITVDVTSAAELEAVYHLALCAAGKALEELNVTGMNSLFGALYNEETGCYELTDKNIFRAGELTYSGYSALYELSATATLIQIKLFSTGCEHDWIDATCTAPKTCSICGETEGDPLGHTAGAPVEENRVESTCTVPGSYDVVVYCSVCGEELSRDTYEISVKEHEYTSWIDDPENEYVEILVCWMCGEPNGEWRYKTHEHVYEYEYRDATRHYRTCTICGEGSYAYHPWDEGFVAKEPTCIEQGVRFHYCAECNGTLALGIPMIEHAYEPVVTAPTCTEQGYTTYTCVCGDSYIADYTDALGHSFGEWIEQDAPTCVDVGIDARVCGACGEVEYRNTDAKGHELGDWYVNVEPTCKTEGENRRDCVNCDHYETEVIPTNGILGDVDCDGAVTISDAMLVLQYDALMLEEDGIHLEMADVDGDGEVTISDAMLILQYDALIIDRFPAEQ